MVVFDGRGEFVGGPVDKDYVKRVIGVEGDRVACCVDGRVTVQPAGSAVAAPLDEPVRPRCAGRVCPRRAAVGHGRPPQPVR